ncbi:MAG: glycosyltransferase [Bacteroidota bacterium]
MFITFQACHKSGDDIIVCFTRYSEDGLNMGIPEIIYAVFTGIQLFYILFFFSRILFRQKAPQVTEKKPVSVIICARNESENLKNNLPKILNQNYPSFEVIVVNDSSTDDSQEVLMHLSQWYKHLKICNITKNEQFFIGKKFPLTIGIKAAKNEILLFTDADCSPAGKNWISGMQQHFTEKTSIVLGYGGFVKTKGFLDKLVRYDTMHTAMQYLGLALAGIPYMGVGRNLAYMKSVFFGNKGFASHYRIISGDDDLFINEVIRKGNYHVEYECESHTRSAPVPSFRSWIIRKKRHLTTGKYYRAGHAILLFTEPFTRVAMHAMIVLLFCIQAHYLYIIVPFIVRFFAMAFVHKKAMKRLCEEDLFISSLFLDIVMPYLLFYLHVRLFLTSKPDRWK